jgi:uncharacterized protein involved in exopolysaccharide biosynthesis
MPFEDEEEELSLVDVFNILWRRKFLIIFLTFIFAAGSLTYALLATVIYRAECRIMPPSGNSSRMAGIAAQLGGLADFVGLGGVSAPGQTLVGILQGNTVVDAIIDKFNLMEEFSMDIRLKARSAVLKNLEAAEDAKSGIISVAYLHEDPQEAADIANAFVEELQKKLQEISAADAQQKRTFFESQLIQAQQELNEAEDIMLNYQKDSGIIAFESQAQSLLSSIASLKNQIAAKNVQISSMQSYARPDNPKLRVAKSELEAMTKELRRLEEEQMQTDSTRRSRTVSGDLSLSTGQIPELGIEYQRYVRQLRFATAKYELLLRQYENARLNEASDLSTITIIDPATPPDDKYRPKRTQICIIGTAAGMCLGIFLAFLFEHIREVKRAKRHSYADDYDDDE